MTTQFNFQINPSHARKAWERVTPIQRHFANLTDAVALAKRTAKIYKAEVRLTNGSDAYKCSGGYFHHRSI
ncbi:hypothetical protein D3C87_299090 [compost metagenome]|uniref:hypothetical protein n=1 Tax=Pedobacter sp. MC2016-24 TaxID=2780090 RepID=UPI000FC1D4B3|nr:hypothetical protein [Pedobacter sp. MC2016-24]MBE9598694.1 hypothetical protein [Pedobacter sp. MC2016-24]